MENVIVRNCIRCKICGDIIESVDINDKKTCRCGAVSISGGHEYISRIGYFDNYEELSVIEEK